MTTTTPTTDPRNAPALVAGSECNGVALFIPDSNGDLVDIEYLCATCAWNNPVTDGALRWPAFDFGDFGAYCRECQRAINA